jgi:predicted RNase H-like HicB family nuclease
MEDIKLNLTGVFIKNKKGGFTAYIAEIPGTVAQGETMEKATDNLFEALNSMVKYNKEEDEKEMTGLIKAKIKKKMFRFKLV